MKNHLPLLALFMLLNLQTSAQQDSEQLDRVIQKVQEHRGYDRERFPLGNFSAAYYRKEAEFAQEQLEELEKVNPLQLSETDKVSLELLKYSLQERIDEYEFEAYLNPLLSDAGFHVSLPYHVRDLNNYQQVKDYLKKLQAVPQYVEQHLVLLREGIKGGNTCLLYTSPSPRDRQKSRMPSSA